MIVQKFYIKTHSVTKLNYFGTHRGKQGDVMECHRYKGSGTWWINHIKKHGYSDVYTQVVAEFDTDDIEAIIEYGMKFSKEKGIVESKEWANLMDENGLGGWTTGTEPWNKGLVGAQESWCKGLTKETSSSVRKMGESLSKHLKENPRTGSKNPNFGNTGSKNPLTGTKATEKRKELIRQSHIGRFHPRCSCLRCGMELGIRVYKRHICPTPKMWATEGFSDTCKYCSFKPKRGSSRVFLHEKICLLNPLNKKDK